MNNWEKLCRTCLTTKEKFNYFLFDHVTAETFLFCTSIKIKQHEDLPRAVCDDCFQLLKTVSVFKRKCRISHKILTGFYNIKSESTYTSVCENDGNESKVEDTTLDMEKNIVFENDGNGFEVKREKFLESYNDVNFEDNLASALENTRFPENEWEVKSETFLENYNDEAEVQELKDENYQKENKKTPKIRGVRKHKKRAKNKHCMKYKCDLCRRHFKFLTTLEAHKLKDHEGKTVPLKCVPCKKTFVTWNGLYNHNNNFHKIVSLKSLMCNICGRVMPSQSSLKSHKQRVHKPKIKLDKIICDACGKLCNSESHLKMHQENHNENKEKTQACSQCDKKFFNYNKLQIHIMNQHRKKSYICDICNALYHCKRSIARHVLKHENRALYHCDICSKPYSSVWYLKIHKRLHSGEKPFMCSFCLKRFVSKERLNEHVLKHTGMKPFKCKICDKCFSQCGTMNRHVREVHKRN